jgi:threonine dehydrogenase-like Zn-dependent dehydrogenase
MVSNDKIRQIVAEVIHGIGQPPGPALTAGEAPAAAAPAPRIEVTRELPAVSKAAVLVHAGRIEIRSFPVRPITDDEILVQIEGCGVCGTDVHEYQHDPMHLTPLVLGHEGTGRIIALGKNIIFRFVRRGAGVCEVGHFVDGGEAPLNPHRDFCSKEVTLVGSWVYTVEEYPIAYNFMRRAQGIGLPVEDLITHRFPLDRIEEAIQVNLDQQGLKVVYDAAL